MQSEEQQEKKNEEMRKMNRAFEKYGKLLSTNIHVIEVTSRRKKGIENIFEEIMAKKSLIFIEKQ